MKTLRKYHKWPSLFIGFFLLLFALSGIVMNHRDWVSSLNFPRQWLPPVYHYNNWNLAALKGNIDLNDSTLLVYGNIGIYKTNKQFSHFADFNTGLGNGMDDRKIFTMLHSTAGQLFAGTLFGLQRYDFSSKSWIKTALPGKSARVVKITQNGDTLFVLTRSHLYTFTDEERGWEKLAEVTLPKAANDDEKAGLFRTLWIIHSGELLGLPGKIVVDLLGLIVIFITLSGFYYTLVPSLAKRSGDKLKKKLKRANRFSINWHNKLGVYGMIFLLITVVSGMFLRPPLLIPIAYSRVNPIPGSILDHVNPWHDKLRDMLVEPASGKIILSSSEGFYWFQPGISKTSEPFNVQPEVSVMGITVFEHLGGDELLVGSFSGLFRWNTRENKVYDYITGLPAQTGSRGNPFGAVAVSGIILEKEKPIAMIDYAAGWIPLHQKRLQSEMPAFIRELPISLWNLSLEVHTGRIFSVFLGDFYILYVPLMGLTTLLILITGFVIWYKTRKRRKKHSTNGENQHENNQISAGAQGAL
jgi:hypothetical protein